MEPALLGPGEGERHQIGPSEVVFKLTGEDLYLAEGTLPASTPGPPPHTHEHKTDMFYVLEGTLTVLVGQESHDLAAGSFVAAPPGTVHTFRNDSDAPVRFLNMSTPGGWENYMRDVSEAVAANGMSPELIESLSKRHDVQLA